MLPVTTSRDRGDVDTAAANPRPAVTFRLMNLSQAHLSGGHIRRAGQHERRPRYRAAPSEAVTIHAGVGRASTSMAPVRLRATTEPPKPAPVIRAP